MTNDEAIKTLENAKNDNLTPESAQNVPNQAFKMQKSDACSDTISRREAIDALGDEPEVWSGNDEYAQGLNNQWHYDVNALRAMPSAQPDLCDGCDRYGASCVGEGCGKLEMPEIIRCEDCKYHRQNDYGDSWCAHPKGLDGFDLMPTDFCSKSERRTDGTEQP